MSFALFLYFGFLKAEEGIDFFLLALVNVLMWMMTAILVFAVLSGINHLTTDDYSVEARVKQVKFIPEHTRLVGKVIQTVPDAWRIITNEKNVYCDSTLNIFDVGDRVHLSYSGDGAIFNATYCNTIQLIE